MSSLTQSLRRRFAPVKPLEPGIYQYKAPLDASLHYRLHLRIEPGGAGVLLVNASTILHLNRTATEYAYHLVKGTPKEDAARQVSKRYRVNPTKALADYEDFCERVETLLLIPDLDPVSYLDFERVEPYSGHIIAPYRLDCALTYRLPQEHPEESAPTDRVDRELSSTEWKSVLDKAWEVGIPHITFTGGEPTLREDLPEPLNYAEDIGQVTGLITDGNRLADSAYLDSLLQAGLDHIMLVLHPDEEKTWESLASFIYWSHVLDADLYVAAHLTITAENAPQAPALLKRLADNEIHAVSLSANDPGLAEALETARDVAADLDLALTWDLPVPYSAINPVAIETQEDHPEQGGGRAWLYVEPDGDVLPSQGTNQVLGNFLKDPWDKIWKEK